MDNVIFHLSCRVSDLIQQYHSIDLRCLQLEKELLILVEKLEDLQSHITSLRND